MLRLTGLLLAALALAMPAAAEAKTSASARLVACDAGARTADFAADMRAIPGSAKLQLRFTLQVLEDGAWQRVAAPTLDTWTTAAPGRLRYVYDKRVVNLQPGAYRVSVKFRWRDAAGQTLKTAVKRTRACRVPDPRPDLVPMSVQTRPGATPDTREYIVVVANQGRAPAGAFDIALAVDGVPLTDQTSAGLNAGARMKAHFLGPACAPGGTLVASVDASGLVEEADEADDTLSVPC